MTLITSEVHDALYLGTIGRELNHSFRSGVDRAITQQSPIKFAIESYGFAKLKNPEISHADVVVSYLGLLTQGKSDFDQIKPFRQDEFFALALGCQRAPSAPTLCQRLDAAPHSEWETIARTSKFTRRKGEKHPTKMTKQKTALN